MAPKIDCESKDKTIQLVHRTKQREEISNKETQYLYSKSLFGRVDITAVKKSGKYRWPTNRQASQTVNYGKLKLWSYDRKRPRDSDSAAIRDGCMFSQSCDCQNSRILRCRTTEIIVGSGYSINQIDYPSKSRSSMSLSRHLEGVILTFKIERLGST